MNEIEVALVRAGRKAQDAAPVVQRFNRGPGTVLVGERTVLGVWVIHPTGNNPATTAASALIAELRKEGILTDDVRQTDSASPDLVHIWVGVKP